MSSRRRNVASSAYATTTPLSPGMALTIRDAWESDVPAITQVFNQGVEDGMATLEPPHSVQQRAAWFRLHGPREPILVAASDALLVGWASLSQYSPRMCYDSVKELSICVRREWRGRGVGDALLSSLLQRALEVGLHKVVLFCFPSNGPAVQLYHRHGFVEVGLFHHHGVRNGVWQDILAMGRHLADD